MASLASDVYLTDTSFFSNKARNGGAMHSISGTSGTQGIVDIRNSSFVKNEASDAYGATYFEFCQNCILENVHFENNYVNQGSGGAIYMVHSSLSRFVNSTFKNNVVGNIGGAMYLVLVDHISVINCKLFDNIADIGGAMNVFRSDNVSLINCELHNCTASSNAGGIGIYDSGVVLEANQFSGNNASTGYGSALYVSASALTLRDNSFSDNWCGQAGTLFWDYFSAMSEPEGLMTWNNVFSDSNVAAYGPSVATAGVKLVLINDTYDINDYTVPAPPIVVQLYDYYNHTVLTESRSIVEVVEVPSYCHGLDPYITGGINERFHEGVATFSTMSPFCAAGYNLTIRFSSSLVPGNVEAVLFFRDCVRGEYFSERVCTECPLGSYSLVEPDTYTLSELSYDVCQSCPDSKEVKYCEGDDIYLKEGYWRISTDSDAISSCPKDGPSCLGGLEAGDDSCNEGYHGPLCAICNDDYYYSSTSNTCEACTTESSMVDPVFMSIFILGMLILIMSCYVSYKKIKGANIRTMDDLVIYFFFNSAVRSHSSVDDLDKKRIINQSRNLRGHVKIYVTYFQILATLPHILEAEFPRKYTNIISAAAFLNLEIVQSSVVSCSSSEVPDHLFILYVETLYPFGFALLIFTLYKLHVLWSSRVTPLSKKQQMTLKSTYMAIVLTFTYLILPHITAHVLSTFNCTDVDEGDVVEGDDEYLAMDLSVSCSSDRSVHLVL